MRPMAVMSDSPATELSISVGNSIGQHQDMPYGVKIPLRELHLGGNNKGRAKSPAQKVQFKTRES